MSLLIRQIQQSIRGWVFPPSCGICEISLSAARQIEAPFLCNACEETLTPMGADACRLCGQSYTMGEVLASPVISFRCSNCADRELAMDFAVSAYRSSGEARELMHAFKYGKQIHLARLWGYLLQRVWEDSRLLELEGWTLVPVPLHHKRLSERGFNQSKEIAIEFMRQSRVGIPLEMVSFLKRTEHTVRQAQLDRKERLRNLSNAFALKKEEWRPRPGNGVLLIDDVMTTATTVSECAAIFRREWGAETPIAALSVLRG